jgi:Tol biopolymer transport system component
MKRYFGIGRSILLAATVVASGQVVGNAEPRPLEIDDYFALESVGDPQISPDGQWVAYTVSSIDLENDSRETRIWMIPVAGGKAMPMTAKGQPSWSPRWRPDGRSLAFMSARGEPGTQVYTLDMRGGEGVQITAIDQGIEGFEWSPDGTRMVLVIRDPAPEEKPLPWVIDRLKFKEDYVGYLDRLRAHLYVFNIEAGTVSQITSGDYEDYSPAWSPDGTRIAFVSNRTAEPDASSNSDIWLVDPDTSYDQQEAVRVTTNPGPDGSPVWHPDRWRHFYTA